MRHDRAYISANPEPTIRIIQRRSFRLNLQPRYQPGAQPWQQVVNGSSHITVQTHHDHRRTSGQSLRDEDPEGKFASDPLPDRERIRGPKLNLRQGRIADA